MYKTCKTEQSAARQKAIAAALLQEMERRSYGEVTITDLCARLQMPRKTFYRYFDAKEDALICFVDDLLLQSSLFDPGSRQPGGVDYLEQHFRFWLEHRHVLDLLQRNALSGLLVERGAFLAAAQQMPLVSGSIFGDGQKKDTALLFTHAGLTALVLRWHHTGCRETPRQMAEAAFVLLTRPLFRSR